MREANKVQAMTATLEFAASAEQPGSVIRYNLIHTLQILSLITLLLVSRRFQSAKELKKRHSSSFLIVSHICPILHRLCLDLSHHSSIAS